MAPDDWQRVRSIRIRALHDAPDAFATTVEQSLQRTEASWRSRLASTESVTMLASDDGQDIGLIVGAPYDDDAGLFAMWVAPEARGMGVGHALVKAVVQWAAQLGYTRIFLDVGDSNQAAIALYTRHGFDPTGVTGSLDPPREHITGHQRCRQI